jgi:hypothetical protein
LSESFRSEACSSARTVETLSIRTPEQLTNPDVTRALCYPAVRDDWIVSADQQHFVELLGHYSNPDNVSRLSSILAGQGRDRPSGRTIRSPRRQSRLDLDQTHQLVEAYRDGVPINDLASRFRIHRTTVLKTVEREGVPRRWGVIERNLDEARRLYESGLSLKKVGEHFTVSLDSVRDAFLRQGIPIRPRNGWRY